MKELTFVDALRYVFSGVIAFCYYSLLNPTSAASLATSLGPVGLPLVLAVLGSLIYFVYRPLLYDLIIHPLHGALRGQKSNYRKLLRSQYQITSGEAGNLFRQIRAEHLSQEHAQLAAIAAGTHMTYMAGLLAIAFAIAACLLSEQLASGGFGIAAAALLVCGYLLDWRFERQETDMIRRLGVENWDPIANKLGMKVREGRQKLTTE